MSSLLYGRSKKCQCMNPNDSKPIKAQIIVIKQLVIKQPVIKQPVVETKVELQEYIELEEIFTKYGSIRKYSIAAEREKSR
ncbi:Hypothetical predicted protein [Paramuricea clavata]|uniref:Uncharacterized protein n=1 Tax=Paramuricea clavata TaxID=317549 RepID=A0A6S7IGJ2_PARCT|nr:Hypothetical predicted protein [Paramuricea clavata]